MILGDMHPAIREALAAQGMFLKMGFHADHIYVMPTRRVMSDPDGVADLAVVVRREFEYSVYIGECQMTLAEFRTAWSAATKVWNAMPLEEREAFVDGSNVRQGAVAMIADMTVIGFNLKRGADA